MKTQLVATLVLAAMLGGCGRNNTEGEVEPTATPVPVEETRITVRMAADRSVPSMVDRFLEAQVVEVVNGEIKSEAPVVASTIQDEINHLQGMPSEWTANLSVAGVPGKEYGLRVGVFDGPGRGTMLLEGTCQGQDNCRFFPGGAAQVYRVNLAMVLEPEAFYLAAVPAEERQKCQLVPESQSCGMSRTMQYYDAVLDTCFPATWGGCGEVTPFRNAGECIQTCRKQWP